MFDCNVFHVFLCEVVVWIHVDAWEDVTTLNRLMFCNTRTMSTIYKHILLCLISGIDQALFYITSCLGNDICSVEKNKASDIHILKKLKRANHFYYKQLLNKVLKHTYLKCSHHKIKHFMEGRRQYVFMWNCGISL